MPEVSVEVVLHPVPAILGRCQCPAPPPPPLHVPWLLRGIIPKQWVAGDWCSPKEQAEGAEQWGWEGLGGAPGPAEGQSRVNDYSWLALPVPAHGGGLAGFPLSIWHFCGCLEMLLTPLDG